jgi:hypothetical protein
VAAPINGAMTERIRFTLELDRGLEPPRGILVDATGAAIPFTGWMQLAAALSEACAGAADTSG